MAVNSTAGGTKSLLEPETLAAHLADASSQIPTPEPALARFIARHFGKSNNQPAWLASGLDPDDTAGLASAIAAALRDNASPVTAATFQPENIRVKTAHTGWQVFLEKTAPETPSLDNSGQQAAFTGLLYRLVSGKALAGDNSGQKNQINQLGAQNPYLAKVLEEGLRGGFTSTDALAGGFGWSLYRKTYLNFPALLTLQNDKEEKPPVSRKPAFAQQLPEDTAEKPANNRGWGGPLALVSLVVALVLLAGTILFSVSGLDKNYRQQSLVAPTRTPLPTAVPPTPTPAVALQTTKQADGATLTRYNAALDLTAGNSSTDPAKLSPGQVVGFSGYSSLQIQNARWSDDATKVELSLKNGGWETWDVASKTRLSRKELPNTEQYTAVSWSPDGQNFAAAGLDGQLRLGKADRILKTVSLSQNGAAAGTFSTYPWPFSWSPDSNYLLLAAPNNNIELWNFQNAPTEINPPQNSPVTTMNMRGSNLAGTIEWSGDSRYLARLTPGDQNELVEIFNPRNLARLYSMTIVDTPSGINNPQTGQNTGLETVSNGLAWSPDGRYIALIRGFRLDTSGTANNYIDGSEGDLVSLLELPDLSKAATQSNQAQLIPNAPVTGAASNPTTPGTRTARTRAAGTTDLTLSPLHLETLTLTGLGDANTAGGRNLVWSKNNRLLVLGTNVTVVNDVQQEHYRALTLDLNSNGDGWHWQQGELFDLPFGSPHNFVTWSPDNEKILYNTTLDDLRLGLVPDGAGKTMTSEILNAGNKEFFLGYFPSPNGRTFLQTRMENNRFSLVLRDNLNNQAAVELAQPAGAIGSVDNAVWSADGKLLVVPFIVMQSSATPGGPSQAQEVIRAWRVEANQPPVLRGDLLAGIPGNNFGAYSKTVSWDTTPGSQAVIFEPTDGKVARWDVTKTLPSLDEQRKTVNSTAVQTDAPVAPNPYFEIIGQVPGKISDGGVGTWTWLPDHKHVIYCSSNCYIQELLAPGVTPTTEQATGIRFDPAPLAGSNVRNTRNLNIVASPDGRMVAVALPSGLVNLYESNTGKLFSSFTAHQGYINALNFSPDGKYLVTTGADRAVKVWDTTSWRSLAILKLIEPSTYANRIQWLPDNKTLVLGASYGNTLLWRALP